MWVPMDDFTYRIWFSNFIQRFEFSNPGPETVFILDMIKSDIQAYPIAPPKPGPGRPG
jgi:hypothetical protein